MSNFVQLSLLQLVKAIESTSSLLPIDRLLMETVGSEREYPENACDPTTNHQGEFQLVLTVFENMLLRLSIEPLSRPAHHDLLIKICCDPASDGFFSPQIEWLPKLLDCLCRNSYAEPADIAISTSVSEGHRRHITAWTQLVESGQVDSGSIVEQLNEGPFRMSAIDHGVIDRARELCMRSIVLQADRSNPPRPTASPKSSSSSLASSCAGSPAPVCRPIDNRQEIPAMPTSFNYDLSYGSMRGSTGFFDSPPPISREDFAELRHHVVNLNGGRFSDDGDFSTSSANVRAMFREHLPRWAADHAPDGPARIVLYAHGGLTNEAWGLHTAAKQIKWWKANGVYPVFFVWETGLLETLRQMFGDAARELGLGSSRGWFSDIGEGIADGWDRLRDRTWEATARSLGVGRIWGRMKDSAAQTFAVGGDGREVLNELRGFCESHSGGVKLHAVGHSAGSIFLTHAINAARKRSVPTFRSVHLLAPAITNELFAEKFLQSGKLPSNVKRLSVFTMDDALELADTVGPYKKSLLYLIYYALEQHRKTDVLGLERSLRGNSVTERLFGLNGRSSDGRSEIVFSKTRDLSGSSASQSTTHGGFDDDVATMESVLRRIKRLSDNADITPFPPSGSRGGNPFEMGGTIGIAANRDTAVEIAVPYGGGGCRSGSGGNRKALCIGINDYRNSPLSGCVDDASRCQEWFRSQQFTTEMLTDGEATHHAIVTKMTSLFRESQPGDVIAIQFAGHGTQVPDDSGDERYGDTPGQDEAFVPHDYMSTGMLVDDDIGRCCELIPAGVAVTFFMDCCHSGTNTRFFLAGEQLNQHGAKARFMKATPEMIEVHRSARLKMGVSRNANPYKSTSEILFSACQSNEVAWESNGRGDFTRNALSVLSEHGRLTCRQFVDLVSRKFGSNRRQTPELWCDRSLEETPLLASRSGGVTAGPPFDSSTPTATASDAHLRSVLQEIRRLLDTV